MLVTPLIAFCLMNPVSITAAEGPAVEPIIWPTKVRQACLYLAAAGVCRQLELFGGLLEALGIAAILSVEGVVTSCLDYGSHMEHSVLCSLPG